MKINDCNHLLLSCSYSLYEPNSRALTEYNGGLEKSILRNSERLSEANDAFCKTHPGLAQKVVTTSAHAAVSKISADALLAKALSARRANAGSLLKAIREVNAIKLEENVILVGNIRSIYTDMLSKLSRIIYCTHTLHCVHINYFLCYDKNMWHG